MDCVSIPPPQKQTAQDDLAGSIVAAWAELDRKAEIENPEELRKAYEMLVAWGKKLDAIVKGKKA